MNKVLLVILVWGAWFAYPFLCVHFFFQYLAELPSVERTVPGLLIVVPWLVSTIFVYGVTAVTMENKK